MVTKLILALEAEECPWYCYLFFEPSVVQNFTTAILVQVIGGFLETQIFQIFASLKQKLITQCSLLPVYKTYFAFTACDNWNEFEMKLPKLNIVCQVKF